MFGGFPLYGVAAIMAYLFPAFEAALLDGWMDG